MTLQNLTRLAAAVADSIAARDAAIVAAAKDGWDQQDICDATGLSAVQVRRIERAGGLPPRKAGRPAKTG